ncbi:MAG: TIGR01777 family oxidoreductase [Bacteroidetes bacterium]|nr:TIGR01777 family oxidoreductase [Bacteroidota bacterium]
MERVLIAGGTGLVGKALTSYLLERGYHVIILTRNIFTAQSSFPPHSQLTYSLWNPTTSFIDPAILKISDHIINLAGAGVADKRWSSRRKKEIFDSRVIAGACIVRALEEHPHHVKTVVNASAIGWYGPDTATVTDGFSEEAPSNADFLGATCKEWERSAAAIDKLGIRVVTLRIGIVLTPAGGALLEFIKPLRWGIATMLGNGKQIISWIHIHDLVSLFEYAIIKNDLQGVYNAVAPKPVTNQELVQTLAVSKKSFFISIPIPAFLLKLIMGEMSIEVLKSTTVSSKKIMNAGFQFRFPTIQLALRSFF